MNQVRKRFGIEPKFFLRDGGNQLGAGFVVRFVKHVRARLFAELFSVDRRQKRALMMVKPPRHFRRIRKLEIYNYIFVAVEEACFPGLRRAVRHPCKTELRALVKSLAIKHVKDSGGSRAIKTAIEKSEHELVQRLTIYTIQLN